jgi:MFS family permease
MNKSFKQKKLVLESAISAHEIDRSLHYSIVEGTYSTVMGSLTGGVFLTGFALSLGAGNFEIGLLAAIPALASFIQIPASYFVEQSGKRRKISLRAAVIARSLWIPIALLPILALGYGQNYVVSIFLGLIFIYALVNSVNGLAWLSWLSDLVPKERMGNFFAKRTMVNNGIAMLLGIGAGQLIDTGYHLLAGQAIFAFSALFVLAVLSGMISVHFLAKMVEPPAHKLHPKESFLDVLQVPLKQKNFRRLVLFYVAWNFSVGLAAPFFNVYMLHEAALSYLFVSTLGTISGVTSFLSVRYWGKLSDRFGNKPLLVISVIGKCCYPFMWILTTPDSYLLYIIIHLVGFFDAGLNLTLSNTMLKLVPQRKKSVYIAIYNTSAGLASFAAPVLGGILARQLEGVSISVGYVTMGHFKLLFLLSGAMRLLTLLPLRNISEPKAKSVFDVINFVKDSRELNPLEGIQQATRFLIVEPLKFISEKVYGKRRKNNESD